MPSSRSQPRNAPLDGLRWFAAVAVAIFHAIAYFNADRIARILAGSFFSVSGAYDTITLAVLALFDGKAAVAVFFVLSGAILFDSLQRRPFDPLRTPADFFVRRFLRIYPAFALCLIVAYAGLALAGDWRPAGEIGRNALLADFPLLGASWTLQVEFLSVPVILLSFQAWRARGPAAMAAVCLAAGLAVRTPWFAAHLGNLQANLACVAMGLFIPTSWGAQIARRLPAYAGGCALALMLASRHLLAPVLGGNDLQKVCAAVLVALIYHGNGGALGRMLGRPPCAFLGRISFSFYLYCMPVMEAVGRPLLRHFNAAQHPLEFGLLASIAIVGCTVPIALLSERFIERPCIELGSRLSRHFVPRPAAAAGQQGSQKVGLSLLR